MEWPGPFADPRVRARAGWWLFGGLLTALLIVMLAPYLGWVVFGLFLYYMARPVTRWLRRRGVSGTVAAALTVAVCVLPFLAILVVITAYVIWQIAAIQYTDFERVIALFFPAIDLDELLSSPAETYDVLAELRTDPTIEGAIRWIIGIAATLIQQTFNALLTVLFVFFLLRDEGEISQWTHRTFLGRRPQLAEYLRAIDRGLQSVYFGYTLTLLAITLLAAIVYHALNLIAPAGVSIPHPMLLAIVTGLISVVPLLGRSLLYGAIILYLAVRAIQVDPTLLWFPAVFFLVMILAYDNVIRIYVRPSLSGRLFSIEFVIFAYLLGPPLFGWYGIFLGPLLMVVIVQYLRYRLPALIGAEAGGKAMKIE